MPRQTATLCDEMPRTTAMAAAQHGCGIVQHVAALCSTSSTCFAYASGVAVLSWSSASWNAMRREHAMEPVQVRLLVSTRLGLVTSDQSVAKYMLHTRERTHARKHARARASSRMRFAAVRRASALAGATVHHAASRAGSLRNASRSSRKGSSHAWRSSAASSLPSGSM